MRLMHSNPARDTTAESGLPPSREATKPDLFTIAAVAIVAAVITDFVHEGLGHGGMCVATGGQPLMLSTVHFECSADTRLVAAGGTLAGEEVLRLAEEQINVGKRMVRGGTTRIRRFVTERPVEAKVTLHEEHAAIVRRAVEDPSFAGSV